MSPIESTSTLPMAKREGLRASGRRARPGSASGAAPGSLSGVMVVVVQAVRLECGVRYRGANNSFRNNADELGVHDRNQHYSHHGD